ncbi:hypothetical protein LOTGIDRAFT_153720 [Lottia gigantea]|uniref:Uncharacterized protein n=1 Tax=Lottia gigantea TaxID=225164 RepID=V4BQV2_LOTGI|nr:hypothetical protein LOTGIDRAFT_153720 [Lottia gigantea]ESO91289.1 hypothetical protein LOTGIDRAFT_153720 [Lottia gigantea]
MDEEVHESPNSFDPEYFAFGTDLVSSAIDLLDFLAEADKLPSLLNESVIRGAIYRYESLWLPFAAKFNDGLELVAPVDIEWVWLCHLLSPVTYAKDCLAICGKIIDHKLRSKQERADGLEETQHLWDQEYPNDKFVISLDAVIDIPEIYYSKISYDIVAASLRQREFYYQVSLPHYKDLKFISHSVLRYKKFLYLKKCYPGMFIVPCYDIDLIWHSHQLHPLIYQFDTECFIGQLFNHDDSVNDRSAGSRLNRAEFATRNLWKKIFAEKFSLFGAMYRGKLPRGKLYRPTVEETYHVSTKKSKVVLESVELSGLPYDTKNYKLKIWYKTGYQNFNKSLYVSDVIARMKGSYDKLECEQRVMKNFSFDTKYNNHIHFELSRQEGMFCFSAHEPYEEGHWSLLKVMQSAKRGPIKTSMDVSLGEEVCARVKVSMSSPDPGPCTLRLNCGEYQDCIMPETVEQLWGPIPLPRLPPGLDNNCSVASHRLLNHAGEVAYTCRIIHSLPLLMSAIHVFYRDKMAAVAHLIASDQLPLPQMVDNAEKCITLNPKIGERALLIKNHHGDWGVIIGRWAGVRKGIKPIRPTKNSPGRRGIPPSPGYLDISFYKISSKRWIELSLQDAYTSGNFKFKLDSSIIELDQGMIEIDSKRNEIAENLVLAFSVSLLHVLCQPRPAAWEPGQPMKSEEKQYPGRRFTVPSDQLALIVAAGFLIATPCGYFIRKAKESRNLHGEVREEDQINRMDDTANVGMWGASTSAGPGGFRPVDNEQDIDIMKAVVETDNIFGKADHRDNSDSSDDDSIDNEVHEDQVQVDYHASANAHDNSIIEGLDNIDEEDEEDVTETEKDTVQNEDAPEDVDSINELERELLEEEKVDEDTSSFDNHDDIVAADHLEDNDVDLGYGVDADEDVDENDAAESENVLGAASEDYGYGASFGDDPENGDDINFADVDDLGYGGHVFNDVDQLDEFNALNESFGGTIVDDFGDSVYMTAYDADYETWGYGAETEAGNYEDYDLGDDFVENSHIDHFGHSTDLDTLTFTNNDAVGFRDAGDGGGGGGDFGGGGRGDFGGGGGDGGGGAGGGASCGGCGGCGG